MRDWRNHYDARVFVTHVPGAGDFQRLRVTKRSGLDGITWDVLQRIKDEVLGPHVYAIEVFPPAHTVVNEVNARHLWAVPSELIPKLPTLLR